MSFFRTITEAIEADRSAMRDLLAALVAIPTENPPATRYGVCVALLETRFYSERGIHALAYGPGILAVSHGPKEFVKVSRLLECARVYALTAVRLLGGEL